MVMKDGAKEVARDTALHITLVSTTVHEVRMDVTEAAVIHIWSKSKISGKIYFSYANYTRQKFIDSDLKKPIRRKPKGAVAQAQGRIKRQLEQAQAQREQAAKVLKKEQISVNVNDIVPMSVSGDQHPWQPADQRCRRPQSGLSITPV